MEEIFSETVLASSEPLSTLVNPPEPKTIGTGIVTSKLGEGGAAVIYEIWNPKLEIHRAVKLWRPTLSEKILARFEVEMKITAKLQHPNIVEIHSVGEWNGLPFIEIEKIDGWSLKELLQQRGGSLPVPVAAAIAICICRALAYAHNHEYFITGKKFNGVIHCDIKPANILVAKNGTVKLTDFGIALPSNTPGSSSEKNKITGSLQYMSPEQLTSSEVDVRSDIFSMGIVLYEMFSGTKAFPANSLESLIEKRKKNVLLPLHSFCKELPSNVSVIVQKCTDTDPENRFQSVTDLMQDLEKIYYKYTTDIPEKIIKAYLDGEVISTRMISRDGKSIGFKLFMIFIIVVSAGVLLFYAGKKEDTIAELIGRLMGKGNSAVKTPEKSIKTANTRSLVETISAKQPPGRESLIVINQKNPVSPAPANKGVSAFKNREIQSALAAPQASVKQKKEDLVTDEAILDELWKLVRSNEYKNADRIFLGFPLNDAEYYLAYSEFQIRRGNFSEAQQHALKAMQMSSKRIDANQVRMRSFYLKARALSGEYNSFPDRTKGQAAMEAWYDVKFQYRSDTSSRNYIDADREIRRISAELQ